jgi:hypothetical protein
MIYFILATGVLLTSYSFAQDTVKTVTTTTIATATAAPVVTEKENNNQTGTHFGLKFQPTFTSLTARGYEQDAKTISATLGYGFGASLNYYFNNHFGFHFEVVYSLLTQEYADNQNVNRKLNVSYLDIPLLGSINTDYGKAVNLHAALGPQIGIVSGGKFDSRPRGDEATNVEATIALDAVGIGLGYGAGLDFGLGPQKKTHINLGVRGVMGLSNTVSGFIGLMFKL